MTDRRAPMEIHFRLNGRPTRWSGDPMARLSNALRDDLGLTGTKVGCDAGDCGACTVRIDGQQVCACMVPLGQVEGREVTTVEGLSGSETLGPLQASFLAHGAAQCGICTPGMLMAAAALLAEHPRPNANQVEHALGGVLCRCTGYRKIVEAVIDAHRFERDGPTRVAETPAAGHAVGARLVRADGIGKVSGRECFAADAAPKDALWLRAVRSPHSRASFTLGDLEALVRDTPGLEAILGAADVPGENSFGIYPHLKDQPVFADGNVRYRGEAVLALVGEREVVESFPLDTLPIRWTPESSVHGVAEATAANAPTVHETHPDNVLVHGHVEKGDVDAALAAAHAVTSGAVETTHIEHAYIEPEAGYARRTPEDPERIEIVGCTQAPYMDRDEIARVVGIAPDAVRIVPSGCGGGFGGKLDVSIQPLLAIAAWRLERSVRGIYGRGESMASSTKRHPVVARATASADADGRLVGFRAEADFNTGAYASWGPTVADRVPIHATGPYLVPNVYAHSRAIYTNDTPAGAFRGFGVPQVAILQEALYDDLAARLGLDPFEFRYRNALRTGQPTATGQVLEYSVGLVRCLDALRPQWEQLRAEAEQENRENSGVHRRGVGIGCMWYGCGNTSLSNPSTIRVELARNGTLTLYSGAADIGQGSTTVILQICADALGVETSRFQLVIGDTDRTADAGKTSASRQTFVSGRAAYLAGIALRERILELAGKSSKAALELDGSKLRVAEGSAESVIDLESLPEQECGGCVLSGEGTFDPPTSPLDAKGQGLPYATYGFAAQLCDLEVDTELGTVHLRRFVAAHDLGKAINPTLVEGQIHGGIAQGIGLALMEEYIPGRTENLHDYLIPTFGDVPPIDIVLVEDEEPLGPFGAKGIGEPALVATPPAIFGAIHHATGVRVTRVPLLPHRLLESLQGTAARPGPAGRDDI